jgi:cytoskeletal protein RodZ
MPERQDKPKHTISKVIGGIIGLIILITIVTSATRSNPPTVTTTNSNSTNTSNNPSSPTPAPSTAKVGDTINIGGSKGLAVTLQQIIDPAQGADQYTTPDAGKRFVAVDVKIVNNGTASYQDDANSNITLIGSDNQSYTFDANNVSECTNFNEGQYTLAAGESATGCVVFQMPDGINTAKIQFQTQNGLSSSTGEWTVVK